MGFSPPQATVLETVVRRVLGLEPFSKEYFLERPFDNVASVW
jgi:hypothetical protein